MSFYLLEHDNPHASGGFWGYRSRREPVRLLVVHTSESPFDVTGVDTGAEAVANYLSNTDRAASYHAVGDSDSLVRLLPYGYTAFGARGHNAHAVHLAFAGRAADWPELTDAQVDARLALLASEAREVCTRFGIPVVRLVGSQARTDGARGICGHADVDPDRRSDPGAAFPWGRFLDMIDNGDDMPLSDDDIDRIYRRVWGTPVGRQDYTFAQALDGTFRGVKALQTLVGRIAAGDTMSDEQIAQVVRDAAKNINVDVTVSQAD